MYRGSEENPTPGIVFGIFFTIVFHGLLAAGYLYWDRGQAEALPATDEHLLEFEAVELLMWGEVMPEPGRLPEIQNPAPEESPPEVVEIEPPAEPEETVVVEREPEPEPEPRARERETPPDTPRDSARHNPSRPVSSGPLHGSPDGFRGGTSLSPTALANLFGQAQAQIQRAFRPPGGLSQSQLDELNARVRVYVNEDGRITRFTWIRRSGNDLFDSAAERAVNTFRLGSQRLRLPTHHEQAMRQVLDHGFEITIEP